MSRALNAIALTAIMVLSLFAGGTAAVAGIAQQTESTAPTEITSCTVIDSPGHYVLTRDIVRSDEGEGPCIVIRASDVTVDGNGHVLDGNTTQESSDRAGIATTAAHPVDNVTVANLTLRQNRDNVRFHSVSDARITNVSSQSPEVGSIVVRGSDHVEISDSYVEGSFQGNGLTIGNSEHLSVVNNTFDDGYFTIVASGMNRSVIRDNSLRRTSTAINLASGTDNVISNNTIPGRTDEGITVRGSNNTVRGNTISLGHDGIVVSGSNHTVADNTVDRMVGWAASAEGTGHTFENNSFSGGEAEGASGGALEVSGSGHGIENNSLTGFHGVRVTGATGSISIDDNRIRAVRHVEVAESSLCPDPGVVVHAHGNAFDADSYEAYDRYGVLNHDDDVVNATNNYWGAESGPSSPDGENVTDPVTGEPADETGITVSEGVRFDPWLEAPPENAGVENGTDA
ncbi:right-handed parallel beta-helix repeat-containing protein [Halorarum salinum]|uniref:Right-handed parallel beta-helix repeat-containing protein n=1 Tax=Halorarum salinum TaxID=2743089 RepID=A0A7D5L8R5_9EURY|nr:right-handed parallel beta-helix repeat-containing protein [Halobaculum salinum]QLG60652.1 right-handed parallel beta-helix repeat-containing protein [Halobaculum salinum]